MDGKKRGRECWWLSCTNAEGPEATYCWWVSEWAFTDQTSDLSDRSRSWRDVRSQRGRRLSSEMRTHTRYPDNTVWDRKLRCGASGRHSVLAILSDKWFAYTSLGDWFRFRTYMDNGYGFVCTKLLRNIESWITSSFDDEDIYNSVMTSWMGRQASKNGKKQPLASLEFQPLRSFPFPASNEV